MEKTLHNSDISGAKVPDGGMQVCEAYAFVPGVKITNVPDIKVVGNGDTFQLLCKASSQAEGWMKSTKAMELNVGCLVQVTTQQKAPDGSYAVAEALAFVPGVKITSDVNGGRKLVSFDA